MSATSPASLFAIDPSKIKSLADLGIKAIKLDETDPKFADMIKRVKNVDLSEPKFDPMMADNHPSKTYAEIVKDGKVVGKVYDGGGAETSNAVGAKLRVFFEQTDDRDERAAAIAKAVGGTIRYV